MKRFSVTALIAATLLVAVAETGADAQPNRIDTLSYMCMEPSPRAASLLRYGEYEVSDSGQPVIEIPVWTISTSWCTVPVSFRYRGGGIKYDDISGELGLGWDLDGRLLGRILNTDGRKIVGNSRKDAEMVIRDLKEIFREDVFAGFRELLVQSGKKHNGRSLAKISSQQLEKAFDDVNLNEDQQYLVDMVVNTINSMSNHVIEYSDATGSITSSGVEALTEELMSGWGISTQRTIDTYGCFPSWIIRNLGEGGLTVKTDYGTYSVVIIGANHPNGREVTTGHELLGHGRSLSLGRGNEAQHIDAIQTENFILKVMGIEFVNDGQNHGPRTPIANPIALPSYK